MNPTTLGEVLDVTVEIAEAADRGEEVREKVAALRTRLAHVEEAVMGLPTELFPGAVRR